MSKQLVMMKHLSWKLKQLKLVYFLTEVFVCLWPRADTVPSPPGIFLNVSLDPGLPDTQHKSFSVCALLRAACLKRAQHVIRNSSWTRWRFTWASCTATWLWSASLCKQVFTSILHIQTHGYSYHDLLLRNHSSAEHQNTGIKSCCQYQHHTDIINKQT